MSFHDFQNYLHERFHQIARAEARASQAQISEAGSPKRGGNTPSSRRMERIKTASDSEFAHNKEFLLIKYKDGKFLCLMRYLTHIAL